VPEKETKTTSSKRWINQTMNSFRQYIYAKKKVLVLITIIIIIEHKANGGVKKRRKKIATKGKKMTGD
jgi:hypothetical protein